MLSGLASFGKVENTCSYARGGRINKFGAPEMWNTARKILKKGKKVGGLSTVKKRYRFERGSGKSGDIQVPKRVVNQTGNIGRALGHGSRRENLAMKAVEKDESKQTEMTEDEKEKGERLAHPYAGRA